MTRDVEVAILGAGGAGSSLLDALAAATPGLSVAVIDPVVRRGNDRTWCFWQPGPGPVDDAVGHAWPALAVRGRDGVAHRTRLPGRYVMVRSADYYRRVARRSARLDVTRVAAPAGAVRETADRVIVHTDGGTVRARWVFDSRPVAPPRAVSTLLQHFRGLFVHTERPAFDPSTVMLMDFTVPQPRHGVAFGYVLPLSSSSALVEHTVFDRRPLPVERHDAALSGYLRGVRYAVDSVEDGAIGMTDGRFVRRVGRRVFRIGTAGGATRPATGYTFATMRRQAAVIARRLAAGRPPVPPRPYPRRHRLFDAVLLRAIDRGHVCGADLLTRLLVGQPVDRMLRFLDGRSSAAEELAVLANTPVAAMTRATADYLVARATGRHVPRDEPGPSAVDHGDAPG